MRASGASKAGDGAFLGEGADGDDVPATVSALEAEEDAGAVEHAYLTDLDKELRAASGGEASDDEDGEGEEDEEEEAAPKKGKASSSAGKTKRSGATEQEDKEETERMKDIMMTRKNRKLYERIKRAQEGKRERVEVLETKRKRATVVKEAELKPAPAVVAARPQRKQAAAAVAAPAAAVAGGQKQSAAAKRQR